jgi:hypothetical protein
MAVDMLIDSVDGRIAIPVLIWLSRDFATVADTIASWRWPLGQTLDQTQFKRLSQVAVALGKRFKASSSAAHVLGNRAV